MDPEDEHVHKLVDGQPPLNLYASELLTVVDRVHSDYDACWHYCFDTLPMKLFEAEIRDNLGLHHGLRRMRNGTEDDDLEDRKEADKLQLTAAHGFIELYHTRRFFATIDGFHKVRRGTSLDLSQCANWSIARDRSTSQGGTSRAMSGCASASTTSSTISRSCPTGVSG